MIFMHMADVHLGMKPEKGYWWSVERAKEIRETFVRALSYATSHHVDLLLISGDLFHHSPTLQELKELDYLLYKLPYTRVVWIAGNHDHLWPGSPLDTYKFKSDTKILKGPQIERIELADLHTFIYGFSYWADMVEEVPDDHLVPMDTQGYHILLLHGGDTKHIPFSKEELKWSGFDYIALGHIHKPEMIFDDLMAYPGSLEPLDITETGEHGFYLGEITEEKQQVTFVPFAKRRYVETEVFISEEMSAEAILDSIETEIGYRGEDNIHRVVLQGSIDPWARPDYEALIGRYRIVEIANEAQSSWGYEEVKEEDDMLVQQVAQQLKDQPRALSYAMEALESARKRNL